MDIKDNPELLSVAIRDIALRLGVASEDMVLVGGQSVIFWSEMLGIPLPEDIPALTEDVDFIAMQTDIVGAEIAVSAVFDAKLLIATLDDSSPNSGKMIIDYPGIGKVNVDFLRTITGVGTDEAIKTAFPMTVDGRSIRVLSPILVLQSKVSNLGAHLNKRNREGIAQASLSIEIARRYLVAKCEVTQDGKKPPYQQFEQIIRFSRSDAAMYAYKFHGLDPMASLPVEALPQDDPFLIKRLPVAREHIAEQRKKFDALIQRMDAFDKKPKSARFQP